MLHTVFWQDCDCCKQLLKPTMHEGLKKTHLDDPPYGFLCSERVLSFRVFWGSPVLIKLSVSSQRNEGCTLSHWEEINTTFIKLHVTVTISVCLRKVLRSWNSSCNFCLELLFSRSISSLSVLPVIVLVTDISREWRDSFFTFLSFKNYDSWGNTMFETYRMKAGTHFKGGLQRFSAAPPLSWAWEKQIKKNNPNCRDILISCPSYESFPIMQLDSIFWLDFPCLITQALCCSPGQETKTWWHHYDIINIVFSDFRNFLRGHYTTVLKTE